MSDQILDANLGTTNDGFTATDLANLQIAGRWAQFLGICGFISTAMMAIMAIFFGKIMDSMSTFNPASQSIGLGALGMMGSIFYLCLAAICFFVALYLYNFGTKTKNAVLNNDRALLSEGIVNLKSYFKITGIIAAIVLGIYGFIFLLAILGGIFAAAAR